jgi:hypothetical protein
MWCLDGGTCRWRLHGGEYLVRAASLELPVFRLIGDWTAL